MLYTHVSTDNEKGPIFVGLTKSAQIKHQHCQSKGHRGQLVRQSMAFIYDVMATYLKPSRSGLHLNADTTCSCNKCT